MGTRSTRGRREADRNFVSTHRSIVPLTLDIFCPLLVHSPAGFEILPSHPSEPLTFPPATRSSSKHATISQTPPSFHPLTTLERSDRNLQRFAMAASSSGAGLPIDPTKPGKYPVILSDALLGKPSKEAYTGVRCEFLPSTPSRLLIALVPAWWLVARRRRNQRQDKNDVSLTGACFGR